jgi:hypothetical protein
MGISAGVPVADATGAGRAGMILARRSVRALPVSPAMPVVPLPSISTRASLTPARIDSRTLLRR